MRRIILLGLSLAGVGGCERVPGTAEYELKGRAEQSVRAHLKDPESAQFTDMKYYRQASLVCGKVNARNGFGGYTGPKEFTFTAGAAYSLEWDVDPNKFLRANHECLILHIKELRRENPGVKFDDPPPFKALP